MEKEEEEFKSTMTPLYTWQKEFLHTCIFGGKKKIMTIMSRRMRKTSTFLLLCRHYCLKYSGFVCHYYLHMTKSIVDIIINGRLPSGEPIYRLCGYSCVLQAHTKTLIYPNGSLIQFLGADNRLTAEGSRNVGAGPKLIIADEISLQSPVTLTFLKPILVENKGILVCGGTPRGKANHLYKMYEEALEDERWRVFHKSIFDYPEEFQRVIDVCADDEKNPAIFDSEYRAVFVSDNCSGFIYAELMSTAEHRGNVCDILVEKHKETYTAWDLGMSDATVILIFQKDLEGNIYILDMIENSGKPLQFYVDKLLNLGYNYKGWYLPHDAMQVHMGMTMSCYAQVCKILESNYSKIKVHVIDRTNSIYDGINLVKMAFLKIFFQKATCRRLIEAIYAYQRKYNVRTDSFADLPEHNWASHLVDALRYMIIACYKKMGCDRLWSLG